LCDEEAPILKLLVDVVKHLDIPTRR
jgi:hypothetical protein